MATCQHCGKHESSKWNFAGYNCSNCRPTCINCNKKKKVGSNRVVLYDGEPFRWCMGCGQLHPPEHFDQEPPVDGLPEEYDADELLGLTWRDADGSEEAESESDIPTYYLKEVQEQ